MSTPLLLPTHLTRPRLAHLAAQYPIYKCDLHRPTPPGIFDLRRMSKMSNWTTPFRRIFGDNQSTKMASNWPLWRKAKHSQANRISPQHFRLSFLSLPSHYLLYAGSCLVHFVALQGSWIDSTFYIDNRSSTFSAHRRFCGHILIVSGLSCL